MKRRHFLRSLPGLGWLLIEVQQGFGKALPSLLPLLNQPTQITSLTIISADGQKVKPIPLWWRYGLAYVNVMELATALGVRTYVNEKKRKVVLYLPQNKVLVSADNPFILVDDHTLQMPAAALWENGQIFVPANFLFPLLDSYTNMHFDYQPENQRLSIARRQYNIAGFQIEARDNGTVIRIRSSRYFKKEEIALSQRYDWLHVDLYHGKGDVATLKKTPVGGIVRAVDAFQFDELLSLAFRLKTEPLSKEVYQDSLSNEIIIALRTKEDIPESDLVQAEEPPPDQSDDELFAQLEEERKRWLIDTVVIDPGHGGKDPGSIGVNRLYEKNVVLPIALKLGALIERHLPDVRVVYTRDRDIFIPLRERTQIANRNNGKVFISVHANWNRSKRPNGFETFILGPEKGEAAKDVVLRENSVIRFEDPESQKNYEGINLILATMAQSAFMKQSEYLAAQVQEGLERMLRGLKMKNRGVKQELFWVMVGATMPSILVETGFISNPYDAKILKTAAYQQKIAQGIFEGLKQFKIDYESAI